MPKKYFQMFPSVNYDISGDGTTKIAIDVLRRVKIRSDALLDGAIFYNYQMQEGDTPEIIADKYYGSSQYHWVIMLMNDALDHTYDFALNTNNFEKFLNSKYGSVPRAGSVRKNFSDGIVVKTEWWPTEIKSGRGDIYGDPADGEGNLLVETNYGTNTGILTGSWPAGNSTAIYRSFNTQEEDPFKNIDVDDVITLFVPEDWYTTEKQLTHSGFLSKDSVQNDILFLDLEASSIDGAYNGLTINITGENPNKKNNILLNGVQTSVNLNNTPYSFEASGSFDPNLAMGFESADDGFVVFGLRTQDDLYVDNPELGQSKYTNTAIYKAHYTYANSTLANTAALTDYIETNDVRPTWSVNNQIAFLSKRPPHDGGTSVAEGNHFELYVMDTDGENQTRLTTTSSGVNPNPSGSYTNINGPMWSATGAQIAWYEKDGSYTEIFWANYEHGLGPIEDANKKELGSITKIGGHLDGNKTCSSGGWSPDDNTILFASDAAGNWELYQMDGLTALAPGGNAKRLTFNNGHEADNTPQWSPDGTQIVWSSQRNPLYDVIGIPEQEGSTFHLYVMDANGTNLTLAIESKNINDLHPTFHPGGKRLGWFRPGSDLRGNVEFWTADYSAPGKLGITGDSREIESYVGVRDGVAVREATLQSNFLQTPVGGVVGTKNDIWSYSIIYPSAENFNKLVYTTPAKVIGKSIYRPGSGSTPWEPHDQTSEYITQINTNLNSNTFPAWGTGGSNEIFLRTGVHHFERDVYNSAGHLMLNNVYVGVEQYVNNSIGTASTKRLVTNYEYEDEVNENKRNIYLLKKEYLDEFVDEFETLMKSSV